ncbi:MAG: SPASM domain-containing protein, partial [Planctomycetes bacterium]|nr:SPASM domain-containing protein [Planctomycetota bacterium]
MGIVAQEQGLESAWLKAEEHGRSEPRAVPSASTIRYLELDVTEDCVLRCEYCFRHGTPSRVRHAPETMSSDVARKAVDWFMQRATAQPGDRAQAQRHPLGLFLFGGEPLMQFKLVKEIVCYAERRATECGVRITSGATTNMVLISDEVMDFWREHQMSFNTSIDGTPECHDRFRKFPDGRGSSAYVERAVPKVLAYRPQTTARCTLHPQNARHALENVQYLLKLGYRNIPLIPVEDCEWTEEQYVAFRQELAKISDLFIEKYRRGEPFYLKHLDTALKAIIRPQRGTRGCGAGTGMVLCDPRGDLWPCHRFPGYDANGVWKLGNIFDGTLDEAKRAVFLNYRPSQLKVPCDRCLAVNMCGSVCFAANWTMTGDLFKPSEAHCRIYRMYFEEGMRVHYLLKSEANTAFLQRYYGQ